MVINASNYVEEHFDAPGARAYTKGLTVETIQRQRGDAVLGSGGILRSTRSELPTHTRYDYRQQAQQDAETLLNEAGLPQDSDQEFYRLDDDDVYFVEFAEAVDVPEGHIGLVVPQPNLLRCGVSMDASPVGPDDDEAEAMLSLDDRFVLVEEDAGLAELVVVTAGDGGDP